MAAPDMGNDFQLFSPLQGSGRRESQSDTAQSTADDVVQDWTQWMRWDDPGTQEAKVPPTQSPFDLPFTPQSNNSGSAPQNFDIFGSTEFSPDLSLEFSNPQFDALLGRDQGAGPPEASPNDGIRIPSTIGSPLLSEGASRKRKTGSDDDGSTVSGMLPNGKKMPAKKRAHNVIEKRYRANLNDKISELRDSVPSLRASKGSGALVDDDDGEGVTPANKLNKASILSKATEYIRHLEIRNRRLEEENVALKNRLRQVDKANDQTMTSAASVSSPSNCTVSTESGASSSPSVFSHVEDSPREHSPSASSHPPEGMMKVPDAFKRMRAEPPADNAFSQSYIQYPSSGTNRSQCGGGRRRSHYPNKYMLGALAGLMVVEGMSSQKETDSTAKGLFALPMNWLYNMQPPSLAYWEGVVRTSWHSWHVRAIAHFLFLAVLVVGSAFVVFVYLFNSGPDASPLTSSKPETTRLSSTNFRRQAWLTSIQQVGVPRHRFFHEWYVVTSRCFEYVLRCLMGWNLYSWATGVTEEDEKGRVKTWDIAIDAQLAGGDAEVSKSRLVLTIFAAGTLPRSPMRMMLKALHCRILMWRVGDPGSWTFHISNDVARGLARYQWDLARQMNDVLPSDHPDALPSYLAALLKIDSEEVMTHSIIERAANLTWNRPTQEGIDDDEALLDVVEEDPAIQSSLDALAAWWSSHLLQRALLNYFEASSGGPEAKESRDLFKNKIKLALQVAPQPSAAHTRALAMMAVFFEQDRVANIGAVLAALPKDNGNDIHNTSSNFLDSSLPVSVREEISIAVRCAMIAAIFTARTTGDTSLPSSFTMQKAISRFNRLPLDPVELTLLGFGAVYHLLHVLASDTDYLSSSESSGSTTSSRISTPLSSEASSGDEGLNGVLPRSHGSCQAIPHLGRVASELMYWARNAYNPAFYGFTPKLVKIIETECTGLCVSAGIDVASYPRIQGTRTKSKRSRDRKKRKANRRAKVSVADKQNAIQGHIHRRSSLGYSASDDTGYGSLGTEDPATAPGLAGGTTL